MTKIIRNLTLAAGLLLPASSWAQALPEAVTTQREMVVTANPLATAAGADIPKQGGTAVDAVVAVQTVLGLVEPQSSGIGGGAFVVYYDAASDELITIDARETAPIAATEDRFLDENGNSIGFFNAWQSGLSVGVPGVPAMMELLHDRYGTKPWQRLFRPAQTLALGGYEMTGRTADQVNSLLGLNPDCENRLFFRDPIALEYFTNGDLENCAAKPAGTVMRNRDYADLMKILSKEQAAGFYTGPVAEAVVDRPEYSRRHDARRSRDLHGAGARSRLHRIPQFRRLRHGPSLLRWPGGRADPRDPRELRFGRRSVGG